MPFSIRVKDYRPISLIHSFAEIVCKILANRHAPHLQQLIPHSQSAFIKQRSIQDNFLYVRNTITSLHKKNRPALFLKLDIAGAFDSVDWGYLLDLVRHMGFGQPWCDLISLLWSSGSSKVLVNGELAKCLVHKQGLRQGDPLSPMLFTLAVAPLHWIFERADAQGLLTPLAQDTKATQAFRAAHLLPANETNGMVGIWIRHPKKVSTHFVHHLNSPLTHFKGRHQVDGNGRKNRADKHQTDSRREMLASPSLKFLGHLVEDWLHISSGKRF